jgi:hypothetical protein
VVLRHIRVGLIVLALGMAMTVRAGESPPIVQAEIASLLGRLETSDCKFNRNGSWYSGEKAKAHMLAKLHYLEARTTLSSTEQFIELAATKSSISGKPYLVQCGDKPAQKSEAWLTTQLKLLRAARAGGSNAASAPAGGHR